MRLVSVIPTGLALTALAGCATTQQEAARLSLNSARIRASELAVHVTRRNSDIAVAGVALVSGSRGDAVVVRLRNLRNRPLSDLPISVGVFPRNGRKVYLNGASGIDYFQTHIPAISPGGLLTWVYTTGRRLPATARPFAEVGLPGTVPVSSVRTLPRITVARVRQTSAGRGAGDLRLTVSNLSAVPQYELQVYAVARSAGRYVAAGKATIAHLGTGAGEQLELKLLGDPAGAALGLQAPPTIFG